MGVVGVRSNDPDSVPLFSPAVQDVPTTPRPNLSPAGGEGKRLVVGVSPLVALVLAACATPIVTPASDDPAAIHARVLTLDTHIDVGEDIASAANDPGGFTVNQVDLPKMRAGGLDAGFFILYSAQGPLTPEGYAAARLVVENKYAGITRMAAAYPDQIGIATSAAETRAVARQGRLVALFGMENAYPLGESVADVPMWAERGVRYVGLVHFDHNQFGDSANGPGGTSPAPPPVHDGLSPLGEELVAALNREGVMVDVSHAAKSTMMDAVAVSRAPIIASHSAAGGLVPNPRSLDDEQLRALAANGGVAQIVAYASYVRADPPERTEAIAALRERLGVQTAALRAAMDEETAAAYAAGMAEVNAAHPPASLSDFVDHIDHAVAIAGIDHVGVASDFDGGGGVTGWMNAAETGAVTAELVRRGYTEAQIEQIWSGNLLRVLDEVQAIGRQIMSE